MGTYWVFVGISAAFGLFYLMSAFVALPAWLAPRRFPAIFGLVCVFLPDRWGMAARRVLSSILFFFVAGTFAFQALKLP